MHPPKLAVKSLHKTFEKRGEKVEALRDISFQVERGEFLAILGASGCGKTTLLRILDGLEPATSGTVLVDGQPQNHPGPDRGFVFQADTLFPWRSVIKNVMLGLQLQKKPRSVQRQVAKQYLELVGLQGFENHYPHELSGGMRQRANLARALSIEPEVFLMDEPFAALDSQTREMMQAELLRIWSEADSRTVVFITHQLDEAIFLADRIIVLTARPGRVKEVVNVDFERPRNLEIKRTPEFVAVVDHLWRLIEEEVQASMTRSLSPISADGHDSE